MKVVVAGEMPFVREIGQLCSEAGHDTVLYLVEDFQAAVNSGWSMPDAANADVAIEILNESADAKQELLVSLAGFVPHDALIIASALASSVTQAASWVQNPQRVVGFSVVPPLSRSGVVEFAKGLQTDPVYLQKAFDFCKSLDQTPVEVADGPGLVRARAICCLINEAAGVLFEGVASVEDIDKAMKLGTNYPYGPLEWADYFGIDSVLGVLTGLYNEWGEDRYRASPLLRRMVQAGKLGRKTGEGFYSYEEKH